MKSTKAKSTSNDVTAAATKQNFIFRIKRHPNKMATKSSIFKHITICIAALQLIDFILITNAYNNHQPGSPYYDPENQVGNISPAAHWKYDDHQDEDTQHVPVSRRVSDSDLDDGLEEEDDEDRDDYAKSGSTNRGQYVEDPAFGESDRAAKDGDDIEGFFDKHLGPQAAIESENNSDDDHEISMNTSPKSSTVDHYEAAASSPLSNIFQSLLNAHKRPFIIHTTEEDPNSTGNNNGDSLQSTSSSTPVGSSVQGTPQGTAYVTTNAASVPSGYAAPIAYYTPVAAQSSYDQSGANAGQEAQTQEAENQPGNQAGQEEYPPVREIYISRRPTQMNHYQTYAPASQGLEHQSSNAYWRGSAATTGRGPYGAGGGDYQGDYARYPVAASDAYQREQQQSAMPDEEQTVSFGLSFGRRPSESGDDDSQDQSSVDESSGYEPGYGSRDSMLRHSSSMRSYNNYNYNYPPIAAQGYTRLHPGTTVVVQQQSPYHGARYHKDPSESSAQPVNYGQYSGSSSALTPITRNSRQQQQWVTRQQLLANLDRQIKNNPNYRRQGLKQQLATSPAMNQVFRQKSDTLRPHSNEIDAFKSFTTTSRVLTEPSNGGNNLSIQLKNNNNGNQPQQISTHDDKNLVSQTYNAFEANRNMVGNKAAMRMQNGVSGGNNNVAPMNNNNDKRQYDSENLMTGPINVENSTPRQNPTNSGQVRESEPSVKINRRVRREDSEDRENEDPDDDGVWVDDDEDDDNKQQSSDVNETSQQPEGQEDDGQHEVPLNTPAYVRGTHGYELTPDDQLLVYPG